ncbi:hypothetical protein [Pelosinus fermentans]|uniref:hypothetical protein n=1 Tax=Pelosinus fermentans TaxID=365349 RepID=UPI0006981165|nr:hypothetical protein [Pelosinus fermentans]
MVRNDSWIRAIFNRDFLLGIVLISLELLINSASHINDAVVKGFNPNTENVSQFARSWALFYPGIYAFSMWEAFNRSIDINENLKKNGLINRENMPKPTGIFIGFTIGMLLELYGLLTRNQL